MARDKNLITTEIRLDPQQFELLRHELRHIPGAARKAMVSAVGKTTRATITQIGRDVRAITTLKTDSTKPRIRSKRMPKSGDIIPTGIITVTGKKIPLIDYGGRPKMPPQQRGVRVSQRRPKIGAGFKVYRSDSLKRVRGTFVQKPAKGGRSQIMKRIPGKTQPHIKYGPSVAEIVEDNDIIARLNFDVLNELDKQIASQIDRFLNRSRGRRMR